FDTTVTAASTTSCIRARVDSNFLSAENPVAVVRMRARCGLKPGSHRNYHSKGRAHARRMMYVYSWVEPTPTFKRVLGRIIVTPQRLTLEPTSEARAERGRRFLQDLGNAIRFRATALEGAQ
ncbi:MAG: hypothetical protein ACREOG_07815, partial [Gemmatimonadaceae bacterium]